MTAPARLPNDEVARMLAALREHFGEPVLPVSAYCTKLEEWAQLIEIDESGQCGTSAHPVGIQHVFKAIRKSNLLARTLYLGQKPRKVKCPTHQGHWSGCREPGHCACQSGLDVTGWLPDAESPA